MTYGAVRLPLALLAALLAAGCAEPGAPAAVGDTPSPPPATSTATRPPGVPEGRDPAQRYEVTVTVLESPEHGPQLCAGGVADSLPPQCGGPDIAPFSWDDVEGEQSVGGTTWADLRLVGTFDGVAFHPTERPVVAKHQSADRDPHRFDSPCPEPPGGWRVVDRTKVADTNDAVMYANRQPDVAAVWLTWLSDAPPSEHRPQSEAILNLAFTGDLERHERAARALWGGALCVTKKSRTRASLERVQDRFGAARAEAERAGVFIYGSGIDEVGGIVTGVVLIADDVARRWVDERFGAGWIDLGEGILRPVP